MSRPNTSDSTSSSTSNTLPYPQFPQSQSRFSYATTSPPTPNADKLFYRPPQQSTSPSPAFGKSPYHEEGLSYDHSKNDGHGTGFMGNSSSGEVAAGYGMDVKQLADMLSPPEPSSSSSRSTSSSRKKGKKVKSQKSNNSMKSSNRERTRTKSNHSGKSNSSSHGDLLPVTPPPLPPKSILPSSTPTPKSTRTTSTSLSSLSLTQTESNSHSRHSHSTEIHSPIKALHGRMASASSHQLNPKPSLASLAGFSPSPSNINESFHFPTSYQQPQNEYSNAYHMEGEGENYSTRPSMNYPNPSESFDHDDPGSGSSTSNNGQRLDASLAALPWAQPPPRQPSPDVSSPTSPHQPSTATGTTIRADTPGSGAGSATRTPTYSFLANDPVSTPTYGNTQNTHARRPSANSSIKSQSQLSMPPIKEHSHYGQLSIPNSPYSSSWIPGMGERRLSEQSGYSGMADLQTSISASLSLSLSQSQSQSQSQSSPVSQMLSSPGISSTISNSLTQSGSGSGDHGRIPSIGSAMATKASSSNHSPSHSQSKWSFNNRSKSTKSNKSTASSIFTKRGSNSTLKHRFVRRWEIHNFPGTGGSNGNGHYWESLDGEEVKKKENQMDLRQLVGRAWVLERVLRSGKRVSSQSLRYMRPFTPTSSDSSPNVPPLPHLHSNSMGQNGKHKTRPSLTVSIHTSSRRSSVRRSYNDPNSGGSSNSRNKKSSSTESAHSRSRKASSIHGNTSSRSIRERLGKKLKRTESREDIFTELDSEESFHHHGHSYGHSNDFTGIENGLDTVVISDLPISTVPSPRRKSQAQSQVRSSTSDEDEQDEDEELGEEDEEDNHAERIKTKGEDRIGGKGVIVFPEEIGPLERNSQLNEKTTRGKTESGNPSSGIPNCTSSTSNCFNLTNSPTSPTPLLPPSGTIVRKDNQNRGHYSRYDIEKGFVHPQDPMTYPIQGEDDGGQVIMRYSPQSPHLGHRSPNWRNRQSVISYIETGVWEGKPKRRFKLILGVLAGVVVCLIVGLLVGLLVRRNSE